MGSSNNNNTTIINNTNSHPTTLSTSLHQARRPVVLQRCSSHPHPLRRADLLMACRAILQARYQPCHTLTRAAVVIRQPYTHRCHVINPTARSALVVNPRMVHQVLLRACRQVLRMHSCPSKIPATACMGSTKRHCFGRYTRATWLKGELKDFFSETDFFGITSIMRAFHFLSGLLISGS